MQIYWIHITTQNHIYCHFISIVISCSSIPIPIQFHAYIIPHFLSHVNSIDYYVILFQFHHHIIIVHYNVHFMSFHWTSCHSLDIMDPSYLQCCLNNDHAFIYHHIHINFHFIPTYLANLVLPQAEHIYSTQD